MITTISSVNAKIHVSGISWLNLFVAVIKNPTLIQIVFSVLCSHTMIIPFSCKLSSELAKDCGKHLDCQNGRGRAPLAVTPWCIRSYVDGELLKLLHPPHHHQN